MHIIHNCWYDSDFRKRGGIGLAGSNVLGVKFQISEDFSSVLARKHEVRFLVYLGLSLLMTLTWVFAFVAIFIMEDRVGKANGEVFWFPFVVLNGVQVGVS